MGALIAFSMKALDPVILPSKAAFRYAMAHKVLAGLALVAVLSGGWWTYATVKGSTVSTRYVLGEVARGSVIASVSASGQVSTSNQLDLTSKASGEITSVNVTQGQKVTAGQLILVIDPTEALKSVRDAEANVESAEIALEKLKEPASTLTLTQAEHALTNAQDALVKLYNDSQTDVINAFLDLPDIVTSIEDILMGSGACGNSQWNLDCYQNAISQYNTHALTYRTQAYDDYMAAKKAYDNAFVEYQALGSAPDNASVEKALGDAYTAVQLTSKAAKSANAFIQLYSDTLKAHNSNPVTTATNALTSLNTHTGKLNTHLSTLLSDTNSLKQNKQTVIEKQESLAETKAGANSLDLKSSELSLKKSQNALADAQQALTDYYVRAPFDGVVASIDAKKYETASGVLATLITTQKIAELSLSEVDIAKVKVGNKATLTFDAIDDLSLTGSVVSIDTVGTVDQGVVSYAVKIGFDSQDDRIKSGMTVNAAIQTDARTDVLTVPSGAVKTQGGISYVQVFNPALSDPTGQGVVTNLAPTRVEVETGITDDTNIEIISGLTEGQQIVVRTTTGSAAAPAVSTGTSGTGVRQSGGMGGPQGGAVFIAR